VDDNDAVKVAPVVWAEKTESFDEIPSLESRVSRHGSRSPDGRRTSLDGGRPRVPLPPQSPFLGKSVDRVVILVATVQSGLVVDLERGAVVLFPVRDAAHLVIGVDLVHPPLADVRHVA